MKGQQYFKNDRIQKEKNTKLRHYFTIWVQIRVLRDDFFWRSTTGNSFVFCQKNCRYSVNSSQSIPIHDLSFEWKSKTGLDVQSLLFRKLNLSSLFPIGSPLKILVKPVPIL